MYLSDRELEKAIHDGLLIVKPLSEIGPTSIDLHLDTIDQARIWDIEKFKSHNETHGVPPLDLNIGKFKYPLFSRDFLVAPPDADGEATKVWKRNNNQIIVKPGGFVLWQTAEIVGTPEEGAKHILFVDGKSTRTARTGLVVHLTAPTIHASWSGNITLEIANFGPFHIVLSPGDAVAQIVVAEISSTPAINMKSRGSATVGQANVTGAASKP